MKKLPNKFSVLLLYILLGTQLSFSQQIKAQLEATANGFQLIHVPQEFRAKIGSDVGKLRIKDQKGHDVPFILHKEKTETVNFKPVKFTKLLIDTLEILTIENANRDKKQSYLFKIANSTASKNFRIDGSNDQSTWFSLVSQGVLNQFQSDQHTYALKNISFPLTDYKYIRITINNKAAAPINIMDIGEMVKNTLSQESEKLRGILFKQVNDENSKSSIITIQKAAPQPIDYIQFHISFPNQYYRETEVFAREVTTYKRQTSVFEKSIDYYTLVSDSVNAFSLNANDLSEFFIKIYNEDNPPLQIDSISFFQNPLKLITELQKGFTYTLQADTLWTSPKYDLAKVKLDLPSETPYATIKSIEIIIPEATTPKKNKTGHIILVICSIIGVLVVFYFGISLVKDMKKEKK